jgi:hypothetical protein
MIIFQGSRFKVQGSRFKVQGSVEARSEGKRIFSLVFETYVFPEIRQTRINLKFPINHASSRLSEKTEF